MIFCHFFATKKSRGMSDASAPEPMLARPATSTPLAGGETSSDGGGVDDEWRRLSALSLGSAPSPTWSGGAPWHTPAAGASPREASFEENRAALRTFDATTVGRARAGARRPLTALLAAAVADEDAVLSSVEIKMSRIRSTWSNSNGFGERDRPDLEISRRDDRRSKNEPKRPCFERDRRVSRFVSPV